MKHAVYFLIMLLILGSHSTAYLQETPSVDIALEQLSENLYLDTTTIPEGFDRDTLVRLVDFVQEQVIPDRCTLFPEQINTLPVVVRYVSSSDSDPFPAAAEGYAGMCDVVQVECLSPLDGLCHVSLSADNATQTAAFLAVITIPNGDDYTAQLWGFTAHELAHIFGAIDGPRYPFYEDDKRLAPVEPVSDTYYWFGIAGVFRPGFKGIVWDAWQNTCTDALCDALRQQVFQLDGS